MRTRTNRSWALDVDTVPTLVLLGGSRVLARHEGGRRAGRSSDSSAPMSTSALTSTRRATTPPGGVTSPSARPFVAANGGRPRSSSSAASPAWSGSSPRRSRRPARRLVAALAVSARASWVHGRYPDEEGRAHVHRRRNTRSHPHHRSADLVSSGRLRALHEEVLGRGHRLPGEPANEPVDTVDGSDGRWRSAPLSSKSASR